MNITKRANCSLFFWLQFWADNRTRFVRQSQNKIRPKDFRQDNRSDFRSEPVNFCVSKKRGATPSLHAMASSIRRIGITCYTSLDFYPSSTFLICFLWHTKSNGFTLKHGFLYSPYFGKTWTSIYSIFEVKMDFYI